MRRIATIAANDLRLFLRSKSGYFWLFGSPLLFAIFMGFANRGPGNPANPRPPVRIENRDDGFMGQLAERQATRRCLSPGRNCSAYSESRSQHKASSRHLVLSSMSDDRSANCRHSLTRC